MYRGGASFARLRWSASAYETEDFRTWRVDRDHHLSGFARVLDSQRRFSQGHITQFSAIPLGGKMRINSESSIEGVRLYAK